MRAQGHQAFFVAFSVHARNTGVHIHIVPVHAYGLTDAGTRGVQELDERDRAQLGGFGALRVTGGMNDPAHLVHTQRLGQPHRVRGWLHVISGTRSPGFARREVVQPAYSYRDASPGRHGKVLVRNVFNETGNVLAGDVPEVVHPVVCQVGDVFSEVTGVRVDGVA